MTTNWSVVLKAGHSDTPRAAAALEALCQAYWRPLYAYVRRRGYSPEDAQDLTQGFFAKLLEHRRFAAADPARGRFRSFLLASLNHFLSDEWDKARAQKRGRENIVAIDLQEAEAALGDQSCLTPEKAYDRRWAIALLEQVYAKLEAEYRAGGKAEVFAQLRNTLAGSRQSPAYVELGRQLGLGEGAVKVAVHRLRRRYRELLRDTIADTVSTRDEIDDELRYLLRILSGG